MAAPINRATRRQGETPAGMAAGVSVGDEGQGREGENLDSSQKSNDGKRILVPACSVTGYAQVVPRQYVHPLRDAIAAGMRSW